MTEGVIITVFVLLNYLLLPAGLAVLCFELYLTKKRASTYEKALHEIADQTASSSPSGIRSQRDAAFTTARVALYDPSKSISSGHADA